MIFGYISRDKLPNNKIAFTEMTAGFDKFGAYANTFSIGPGCFKATEGLLKPVKNCK
jgi:hypothetical protein